MDNTTNTTLSLVNLHEHMNVPSISGSEFLTDEIYSLLKKRLFRCALTSYKKFHLTMKPVVRFEVDGADVKGSIQCPSCELWIRVAVRKVAGIPNGWIKSNFNCHYANIHVKKSYESLISLPQGNVEDPLIKQENSNDYYEDYM